MKKLKILFLSLYTFKSINDGYISADLVKQFRDEGHQVVVISPNEQLKKNEIDKNEEILHIHIASGPIQKTSAVRKAFNLIRLDKQSIKILKKECAEMRFDLIMCMISHCAFYNTVRYIKKKHNAFVYNMVKDIFPQNAVDLGMMKKDGLIYKIFKNKENKYYKLSDCLGVISPQSAIFLRSDNPKPIIKNIEVNPNSIIPKSLYLSDEEKTELLAKYELPNDKVIFIYGGNLGKPQGIDFLLECIRINEDTKNDIYFLVIGNGTEYEKMKDFFTNNNINKSKLLFRVAHDDFSRLCVASDVGLVFLNKNFTVPNYPSRVLSYMEASLPIIFAVDKACDAGLIAEQNGYGYNCINGDIDKFFSYLTLLSEDKDNRKKMGLAGYEYLLSNYTVKNSYDIIMKHFEE